MGERKRWGRERVMGERSGGREMEREGDGEMEGGGAPPRFAAKRQCSEKQEVVANTVTSATPSAHCAS